MYAEDSLYLVSQKSRRHLFKSHQTAKQKRQKSVQ